MEKSSRILKKQHWLLFFFLLLLFVKLLIYAVDHRPLFFMGDSIVFLRTAMTGYIPPERSFVYGFIIKLVCSPLQSLWPIIVMQVCASTLTSFYVGYALIRFFKVSTWTAYGAGLLCALEPLQLLNERYIMAETLSLFLFASYIMLILFYLEKRKLSSLLFIQLLGVAIISIRLSYLPIIWASSLFVPLIGHVGPFLKIKDDDNRTSKRIVKRVAVHLVLSVCLAFALLSGYKHLNGVLSHRPPAYNYVSGFMMVGWWAPIITAEDFPLQEYVEEVFDLKYELKNRVNRAAQWILEGGIAQNIKKAIGDFDEANKIAYKTAVNAIMRDPVGAASLIVTNYTDFWDVNGLKHWLQYDIGIGDNQRIPKIFLSDLRDNFSFEGNEDYPSSTPATLVQKYYLMAWPWYLSFLCLPFVSFLYLFSLRGQRLSYNCIIYIPLIIVILVTCSLTTHQYVRYLHPISWLAFLFLGQFVEFILSKLRINSSGSVLARSILSKSKNRY